MMRSVVEKGRPSRPARIPPAEATPDLLERIVGKRVVEPMAGDVLIVREPLPTSKKSPSGEWQYRVAVEESDSRGTVFTSFQAAAPHGEALAADRRSRLLYLEDGAASLLNDYNK